MSSDNDSNKKRKIDNVSSQSCVSEGNLVTKNIWEDTLYKIITDIEENTGTYLDSEAIISDFKTSLLSNKEGIMNKCLECGIDMGRCNPRQLCGKTYCYSSE